MNKTPGDQYQSLATSRWLRNARFALWGAAAIIVALLVGWWQVDGPGGQPTVAKQGLGGLSPGFELTTHKGMPFNYAEIVGKPTLLFFGFLNCPDVCPTTLSDITGWLEKLGHDADRLNVVFVSVDPDRDTQQVMANYLTSFDPRIVGVVGQLSELRKVTKPLGVYFKKVSKDDGDYTMDHTASVLLLDRSATIKSLIDYHEKREIAVRKIRLVLGAAQ